MTEHKNLATALNACMADIGFVRQTGRNNSQGYSYTSDTDLLAVVRPALIKHGLSIIPCKMASETTAQGTSRGGSDMWLTTVECEFLLMHTSGEEKPMAMIGQGTDMADKGAYKGITGAYKYLLRLAFAIATGDNAEADRFKSAGQVEVETTMLDARLRKEGGVSLRQANDWAGVSNPLTSWPASDVEAFIKDLAGNPKLKAEVLNGAAGVIG